MNPSASYQVALRGAAATIEIMISCERKIQFFSFAANKKQTPRSSRKERGEEGRWWECFFFIIVETTSTVR